MKFPTSASHGRLGPTTLSSMSNRGPVFSLEDFLQEPSRSGEPAGEDFHWTQDPVEDDFEDFAAWGSGGDDAAWDDSPAWLDDDARDDFPDWDALERGSVGPDGSSPTDADDPALGGPAAGAAPGSTSIDLWRSGPVADPDDLRPPSARRRTSHFRPEIEGLRTVAVALIVVFHVWFGRVSGGVDVFLFISAFLLSASFGRRLRTGSLGSPIRTWLRTFTRLLPPAVIVILAVLIATRFLLPPSAWQPMITQALASATYWQNILLSSEAVDYYAQDISVASPLQHFWSLSLQGQVFLLWPLLFGLVALVSRRPGAKPKAFAFALFGALFAASLAYSIHLTATEQTAAYFSTPARLWEVAAGTLLALLLPRIDRATRAERPGSGSRPGSAVLRGLAGWVGFGLLVSTGIVLDVQGQFPGWIAIWPITAAALIIAAGHSGTRWGFDRILTMRLPRSLASISYAMYLVHWPILVLTLHVLDKPRAGLADGFAIIAVSLLISWALTRLVDSRFRHPRWKAAPTGRSLAVIGLCLALVAGGAFGWRYQLSTEAERTAAIGPTSGVQEKQKAPEPADVRAGDLVPAGHQLDSQWPAQRYRCSGPGAPAAFPGQHCDMRLPADADYDHLVLVAGSSHARQWIPAMESAAEKGNWQIISMHMDACPFADAPNPEDRCAGYRDWVIDQATALKPDLVVINGSAVDLGRNRDVALAGMTSGTAELTARGIDVLTIRDNPRFSQNMYTCAEKVLENDGTGADANAQCGVPAAAVLSLVDPQVLTASAAPGPGRVVTADLTPEICPSGQCVPVQGNTAVFMDSNHVSKVFATAMQPRMLEVIAESYPDLLVTP